LVEVANNTLERVDTDISRIPEIPEVSAMCQHQPPCPSAQAPDHIAARVVTSHPEQGWSWLCNGVVVFEDTGELLPSGQIVAPHRPAGSRLVPTALLAGAGRPAVAAIPAR
jgi:hypothetical protein